jgi:tRNA (cmo5U34)-methyltransferase
MSDTVSKFDARADEYAVQSRIALAGYDACHELAACLLAAALGRESGAHVLVAGAGGTAQEILTTARLAPRWRYTAVDPSGPMLDLARANVASAGLTDRVRFHQGRIEDLAASERYEAATLVGVLHHLPGEAAKQAILSALAARLAPGAPLILAGNRGAYASRPLFLSAWSERWRQHGADDREVEAKLGKIRHGAEPPASDAAVAALLEGAGFGAAELFFSSLFWGAWIATRTA